MSIQRVTVEMTTKDGGEAVVCREEVATYEAMGWKLKQAKDAPSDGPKTQPIAKSAADMKTSK